MSLKYKYYFVIATNEFKPSLLDILSNVSDITTIKTVVIVNGSGADSIKAKYEYSFKNDNVILVSYPEKGKSKALNFFVRNIEDDQAFFIFTDDDIVIDKTVILKYIQEVEKNGSGYYYGGGVDVVRQVEVGKGYLPLYPASIRGVNEESLLKRKIFLGCNWGAFAKDIRAVDFFNPYFGPGSITGSVGQESQMMQKLLRHGLKPFPIANCRVTHFAPDDYHETKWLLRRKYREGLQKGLETNSFFKTLLKRSLKLFQKDALRRQAEMRFILGMLKSLRYRGKKLTKI
jgi:hypothetical protein